LFRSAYLFGKKKTVNLGPTGGARESKQKTSVKTGSGRGREVWWGGGEVNTNC